MIFTNFPRAVGKKAFKWLLIFYTVILLVVGTSLRLFIHKNINLESRWVHPFLGELDQFLVSVFWLLLFSGILFFLLFVWNFFYPLGVLLEKGRGIRRGTHRKKESYPLKEEKGEWYQLDLLLNKINRDIKRGKADVERERGELEALVSAANDAILAVDMEQNIRYYNAPMAMLLDQKEEGSWGKTLKDVFRSPGVLSAFDKTLNLGRVEKVQLSHQLNMDSSHHYFNVSISPLRDEKKNKVHGAIAIFHDITEQKKTEKLRIDFVANASHELKTPVTSIQGYLSLLKGKVGADEETQKTFDVIEKNVKRLNALVGDLLQLTKMEESEDLAKENINTLEITESIFSELEPLWKARQQTLHVVSESPSVFANRPCLEQTLINLVSNAIKYCQNEAEIRVTWEKSENGYILRVKDNGPGIESYHMGRLFERFYRVRELEQSVQVKGTGLGLAIVRHAMLNQGGTVDVKSAPGLGTEFICFFPKS